jgi:tRNA(fMet)-specific endonuclease VapC
VTQAPVEILLDTDTLSAVMRQQPQAIAQARAYLTIQQQFTSSSITRYEILRGLNAKQASAQIARFDRLCTSSRVLALTDAIIVRAAMIYGGLHQRGELIGDADILIAATALEYGLPLATNNTAHFRRIPDLQLLNWLT